MSLKKSIGWADMTLNPIKGLCQDSCWYCYYSGKRGIAKRFNQDPELRLDLSVFDKLPKVPKKVFLCSTNDYWGNWIPIEWCEAIREKTQEYPQHTFQVLTKQYQNLEKQSPYPDNWWVGYTATDQDSLYDGSLYIRHIEAKLKFVSIEPCLDFTLFYPADLQWVNWVIIGRLTGYGHKYDPKIEWVEEIVRACDKAGVPVFLKDNLEPLFLEKFPPKPWENFGCWNLPDWAIDEEAKSKGLLKLRQEMPKC